MSRIALALIEQLVRTGQFTADDVEEMCVELSKQERESVLAAWAMGSVPDSRKEFERPSPTLSLLNGGKSK